MYIYEQACHRDVERIIAINSLVGFVYVCGNCVEQDNENLYEERKVLRKFARCILAMFMAVGVLAAQGRSDAPGRGARRGMGSAGQGIPQLSVGRASIESEAQRADAIEQKPLYTSAVEQASTLTVEPIEVRSGFFVFEGRYIPPPYVVRSEQGTVYINEIEVPQTQRAPFVRRPVDMHQTYPAPSNRAAQIERYLRQDGLLICAESGPTAFVPAHQAISILDVLLGDEPRDAKVQMLLQTGTRWIAPDQWALLVEAFDAPAELRDRVLALKHRQTEMGENDADYEAYWAFRSGITITGFILAVWALGTLLSCRPPAIQNWRGTDRSRRTGRQVIWLVVLIVVLNIYDLTCTLFANGVGGLWELNPFARALMERNPMIVTFKLALTIGTAILFLVTRYHRLAQLGSWWAAVLYTVLILRWTTFNSIFL